MHSRERPRVDQRTVAHVRQLVVIGCDHAADGQTERPRKGEISLVVRRHRHHGAGAVIHQHIVCDVHRELLAVDGVRHRSAERDPRLRLVGGGSRLDGLAGDTVDVLVNLLLVVGPRREAKHVRVLRGHHEERRPEQRVRPGREHRVVDAELLAAED